MKKYIFSAIILALISSGFKIGTFFNTAEKNSRFNKIIIHYESKSNEFKSKIEAFNIAVINREPQEKLRGDFIELRYSWKYIEVFAEFFDPAVCKFINGAPITKVDVSSMQYLAFEAEGLQVIEEIVFSDSLNYGNLEHYSQKLFLKSKLLNKYLLKELVQDEQIFYAIYLGFVRIQTLGITGFDSPASGNAIKEQSAFLKAITEYLNIYKSEFYNLQSYKNLIKLLNASIKYLDSNDDFDQFDRAEFIRNYGNKLVSTWVLFRREIKVDEFKLDGIINSVNQNSNSIFSDDFINAQSFSSDPSLKVNRDLISLGAQLFFDPILSKNNSVSCASCHFPSKAYSDGLKSSIAFDPNQSLNRNSPVLLNSAYSKGYFYDFREEFLEDQINHVLLNQNEFNSSYSELINKLNKSSEYKNLFIKAFGDSIKGEINIRTINLSIATYVRSLSSFNSVFDQYIRGEIKKIDEDIITGFNLFMGKAACATCHFAPVFNGLVPPFYSENESEIIGVPGDDGKLDKDEGRFYFQSSPFFKYSFKTMTVRNIEYSAPYMHNGVFNTLEEVIDFYNKGGGIGMGYRVDNQTLPSEPLELSGMEIKQLKKFMLSLSDTLGFNKIPDRLPYFDKDSSLNKRF